MEGKVENELRLLVYVREFFFAFDMFVFFESLQNLDYMFVFALIYFTFNMFFRIN